MRRVLLAVLASAAALSVAPAAEAHVCVGRRIVEGWTGACAFGDSYLVCVRDARMYPAVEVYVPPRGATSGSCQPS